MCTEITVYRHGKASLAVDKADDPVRIEFRNLLGFLLIVRTGWIFTAHHTVIPKGCDKDQRVPPDTPDVPAYSQVL